MRIILIALACAAIVFPAQAYSMDYTPHIRALVSGYVQPATTDFAKKATALPEAVSHTCQVSTHESREAFAVAFNDVVEAFSKVSFLRYGPLLDDNRLSRIAFLPDPRGIAQRQINKFKASEDFKTISADRLAEKSVALQGLTALELIAFDKNSEVLLGTTSKTSEDLCRYAYAIAGNVKKIAKGLRDDWNNEEGYIKVLLEPAPGNREHQTTQEAMETVFNTLPVALIILKDQHVLPVITKGKASTKPARLPFSRGKAGLTYLAGNLSGLRAALEAMKLGPSLPEEYRWAPDTISFELKNTVSLVSTMKAPIRENFAKDDGFAKFNALTLALQSINQTLTKELSPALELTAGFNALDGD